jgi:hypothetical protein
MAAVMSYRTGITKKIMLRKFALFKYLNERILCVVNIQYCIAWISFHFWIDGFMDAILSDDSGCHLIRWFWMPSYPMILDDHLSVTPIGCEHLLQLKMKSERCYSWTKFSLKSTFRNFLAIYRTENLNVCLFFPRKITCCF